jgi:hypothetical protein
VREVGIDFRIGRRAGGGVVGRVFVVLSYRAEDEGEVADELETEELDRKKNKHLFLTVKESMDLRWRHKE